MTKLIAHRNGHLLTRGDTVLDFRGKPAIFLEATRAPEPGRTGKVLTDAGEYYQDVFRIIVTKVDDESPK